METAIYIITYVITALAALALIGIALSLVRRKDSSKATITAALSFGFLVLLLLNMSKFKHVKGFGFEAETWDEKQVKAAEEAYTVVPGSSICGMVAARAATCDGCVGGIGWPGRDL